MTPLNYPSSIFKQEGAKRNNTGPGVPENYELLVQFPLPTFHPPKFASKLSGNWDHGSPQEWLQLGLPLIVAFAMGGGIGYYLKRCLLEFFETRIILLITF